MKFLVVVSPLFTRGFTFHEHIPALDMINMNGRMYDPRLGRFFSPDPYVQAPDFTQSFNRYSYVWNNPLKYVDPSGEWILEVLIGIFILAKNYHDGFHANNREPNPFRWDWSRANFIIGGQTNSDGSTSFHLGFGWSPDALPTVGYDDQHGVGFGSSGPGGANIMYPSADQTAPERNVHNNVEAVRAVYGEDWRAASGGGSNFSLARMYWHFQVGGGSDMRINVSSIDFSGTSQRRLGLSGMGSGDKRGVNLFKSGINSNSLAFGKVDLIYKGNNQFEILPNRFDFNIEWQNGFTARNAGTVLGGAINYNLMINPAAALVPLFFGGPYDVYFFGTTYIPK